MHSTVMTTAAAKEITAVNTYPPALSPRSDVPAKLMLLKAWSVPPNQPIAKMSETASVNDARADPLNSALVWSLSSSIALL